MHWLQIFFLNVRIITHIDDVLDELQNAQMFTSIDLKKGFFHVAIDPINTKYTAFIAHNSQWEFLKASFGLRISHGAFGRYLNWICLGHFAKNIC